MSSSLISRRLLWGCTRFVTGNWYIPACVRVVQLTQYMKSQQKVSLISKFHSNDSHRLIFGQCTYTFYDDKVQASMITDIATV